jgi:hypothetical protein
LGSVGRAGRAADRARDLQCDLRGNSQPDQGTPVDPQLLKATNSAEKAS